MDSIDRIIDPVKLEEYNQQVEVIAGKLKKLKGTWVERVGIVNEIVCWYYERKFLKLVKRLING